MDARIRRTQKAIKSSWLQLSEEHPNDKITITAICKQAHINRASFYRYYESPEALANAIQEDLFEELVLRLNAAKERDLNECFVEILRFVLENRKTLAVLRGNHGIHDLTQQMRDLCFEQSEELIKKRFPTFTPKEHYAFFSFIFEGWAGLVEYWVRQDSEEDPEKVIAFANKIINSINDGLPRALEE